MILNLDNKELVILICGLATLCTLLIFQTFINYDLVISDLRVYQEWSYNLLSHKEPHQLPGFPALISLLRFCTFGMIETIYLMQLVCFLGWVVLFIYGRKIFKLVAPKQKDLGLLFLTLYPFFGVSFITYPVADIPAHAAFSALIYYFLKSSRLKIIIFFILCSLLHKMIWPFIGLLLLVSLYERKLRIYDCFFCLFPLLFYYLTIYIYNDFTQFEQLGILRNLTSDMSLVDSGYYPFKGIIECFTIGDFLSQIKGGIIVLIFLAASGLLFMSIKNKNLLFIIMILPIIILAPVISEFVSAAVIRHSKFIVIPFCYYISYFPQLEQKISNNFYFFCILLTLSQVIFSWHTFIGLN